MAETDGYIKRLGARKEVLEKYRKNDRWIRVYSSGTAHIGKVSQIDLDLLYMQPSLIVEDDRKNDGLVLKLEEDAPSVVDMFSITAVTPLKKDYVDFLLSKGKEQEKQTGFQKE